MKQLLVELEKLGKIARIRRDRYILPKEADLITGRITFHPKGFAFVDGGEGEDLFIPPEETGTAMHGDRVVARIARSSQRAPDRLGRTSGHVVRILERAHTSLVGTLQRSKTLHYVVADDPRFSHHISVDPRGKGLPHPPALGDKVVVRLFPWESRHVNPEGEMVEILGPSGAPGVDMLSIIRKLHLPQAFPEAVLEEAGAVRDEVQASERTGRKDCRDELTFTIDPDDARDFDDAVRVEKLDRGWKLSVHIADVSHYVRPGTALDAEAYSRGNSVYLADRVIPMLPENLSNGICSLRPEVERLVFSAFIEFKLDGSVRSAKFGRSVIRSAQRLTYREAFAILKKRPVSEIEHAVHTAWELAAILRKRRFAHGALDLDFPELKVWLDGEGKPVRLEKVENDISHQLIEEFMLAANEAVARFIRNKARPSLYRVHENPDPKRLMDFREFVLSHNFQIGDLTQREELQRLLAKVRGTPEEQGIKIALLKSMQKARYDAKPLGHYGLAKTNYTHFTSPIRRYADLVVHRVLAVLIGEETTKGSPSQVSLDAVAAHISETERIATEAERESVKLKKLEFFEEQSRSGATFDAHVIEVRNYGVLVELPDFLLTGIVRVSSYEDDFFTFDPVRLQLRGRKSRRVIGIGQTIKVRVARVDMFKQEVDFLPA